MAKNMHAKHGDEGSEFPEDKFDEGFSKIDANGNGKLSKEEVFGFFVMVAEKRAVGCTRGRPLRECVTCMACLEWGVWTK